MGFKSGMDRIKGKGPGDGNSGSISKPLNSAKERGLSCKERGGGTKRGGVESFLNARCGICFVWWRNEMRNVQNYHELEKEKERMGWWRCEKRDDIAG